MPVIYNLMDDTGKEIVNAIRRVKAKLSGEDAEELAIDYRDHNLIILDQTGKMIAEAIDEVASHAGQGGGGAADLERCLRYRGTVEREADLPEKAALGDVMDATETGSVFLYDGDGWVCISAAGQPLTEEELEELFADW